MYLYAYMQAHTHTVYEVWLPNNIITLGVVITKHSSVTISFINQHVNNISI